MNGCFGREQLQMLQVGQNNCKCFSYKSKIGGRALEKGYLHQATNSQSELTASCFGREQLQMLHVGQNSCKSFRYKSKIGGRALYHGTSSYELSRCKSRAASRHVGQCNARVCQPAAQYSASAGGSLFLNERTGLHKKSVE